MKRAILGLILPLLLAQVVRSAEGEQTLGNLLKDWRLQKTESEKAAHEDRIIAHLDGILARELQSAGHVKQALAGLRQTPEFAENPSLARLIHGIEIAGTSMACLSYDVPLGFAGDATRTVLRLWTPTGLRSGGKMESLQDSSGVFASVEEIPVWALDQFSHDGRPFLVVHGIRGVGRGTTAVSVWDILGHRCIWVRELEYGDRCETSVDKDDLVLKVAHAHLEEPDRGFFYMIDRYALRNGTMELVESKRVEP